MTRIQISNDLSSHIIVSLPYDSTEIYSHASMKSLGKIMNPLDTLELAKEGNK